MECLEGMVSMARLLVVLHIYCSACLLQNKSAIRRYIWRRLERDYEIIKYQISNMGWHVWHSTELVLYCGCIYALLRTVWYNTILGQVEALRSFLPV